MKLALLVLLVATPAWSQERLPDGGTATAAGGGVTAAWYADPTTRYDHGILGDAIEAGRLVAVDGEGRRYEFALPESQVFEDITPRLADLDGDGSNEIITIRTELAHGAAVAIYGIVAGRLVERAATAPIGQPHRWLSVAGIADFLGNGLAQIAVVKTPHIGGIFELLQLSGDSLRPVYPAQAGYSTHFIGSRLLSLAGIGDVDGDGVADLALPDQSRRRLVILSLRDGVSVILSTVLPAPIVQPVQVDGTGRASVVVETGETLVVAHP